MSLQNANKIDLSNEVREINLSYLILTQRLLRDDMAAGIYRTGLNEEAAQILINLSPAQLLSLASSSTLIVGFRLNDASLLTMLGNSSSGGILQQARVAMAMAQNEPVGVVAVEES